MYTYLGAMVAAVVIIDTRCYNEAIDAPQQDKLSLIANMCQQERSCGSTSDRLLAAPGRGMAVELSFSVVCTRMGGAGVFGMAYHTK